MFSKPIILPANGGEWHICLHQPGEFISDHIRRHNELWEADQIEEAIAILNDMPKGIVIDAGANIGCWSMAILAATNHDVIAFEPDPLNLRLLHLNTMPWAPRIHAYPFALSSRFGSAILKDCAENKGALWMVPNGPGTECFHVPLDVYNIPNARMIKADVEGSEVPLLIGATATIAASNPWLIIEARPGSECENHIQETMAIAPTRINRRADNLWIHPA